MPSKKIKQLNREAAENARPHFAKDKDKENGKKRADQWLVDRGLVETREKAKALIMAGQVLAGTRRVDKPGENLDTAQALTLTLKASLPYVSRGGLKLEKALDDFGVRPEGKIALDIGASTGGFTDCLLQRGASKVFAVDVGQSQMAWKLQTDARVVVMDKTNIRYLENLPGEPPALAELVVIDVSFISLKLVLPAAHKLSLSSAPIVALVKPQFEAGKEQVGKGGIIRDTMVHRKVLKDLIKWCGENNFLITNLIRSPILGTEGNAEFLAHIFSSDHELNQQEQAAMSALIEPLFVKEKDKEAENAAQIPMEELA